MSEQKEKKKYEKKEEKRKIPGYCGRNIHSVWHYYKDAKNTVITL